MTTPTLTVDYTRDTLFTEQAMALLKDNYMLPEEKSPQDALARASLAYCYGDFALAQRIYDYASKGWFMFASPVLSNAPKYGEKPKALPISCFGTYVDDTLESLIEHNKEVAWLSVKGGGIGGSWSVVRSVSKKAPGPIPFLKVVDSQMTAYAQGVTRRGSYAAYLDVSHPDIMEFLNIRVPTGGDENRKTFNLHNAVNITDAFMEAVEKNKNWKLIDPADKTVRDTVNARELWHKILETRFRTGEPYLHFIDESNRKLPEAQKKLGLRVHSSQLCSEIILASSPDRTFVCCLSSVNLEKYDEWKDTNLVRDLIRFLDNVIQFFVDNAPDELSRAKYSASRERALALGAMGFHGYLQSKLIPFESAMAVALNRSMFKHIKEQAVLESLLLGKERGEAPDMVGTGLRNSHLLAPAPNANNSLILGASSSIEPIKSNAYAHRTRAGTHVIKNKYLAPVLEKYGKNNEETWKSIVLNQGAVQHLEFLSDDERATFKTAFEMDQHWVVEQAAKRQEFICQAQSVNLFFPAGAEKSYVNSVHLKAWRDKLKTLYYLRTSAGVQVKVEKKERVALKDGQECLSCSG